MKPGASRGGKPASPAPPLRELAQLYGIQSSYVDIFGRRRIASGESLLAVLRALGAPMRSVRDAADALQQRLQQKREAMIEPVLVAWNGALPELILRLEAGQEKGRMKCYLQLENGEEQNSVLNLDRARPENSTQRGETGYIATSVHLGATLPFGYHRLRAECSGTSCEVLVISAPLRVCENKDKSWGAFLPLYALHTKRSWGAGDFSDLDALRRWLKEFGAGCIGTLPFLASFLDQPFDPSPYAPASRLFWNELYVDPTQAPEFEQCVEARHLMNSPEFQREIEALRSQPLVDYRRQMALKRRLIEVLVWSLTRKPSARREAFHRYVVSRPSLRDYAAFRAVGERRRAPWPEWHEPLRSGVIRERDYDRAAQLYHLYAQWLAEEQLSALARNSERGPGLYLDFPLGVHRSSYDVWRERKLFALEASGGAPPDGFFRKGQVWGFPPLHPDAIRKSGYRYWIDCLRHQFRHAAALRIDHVMGLHRLFWVPNGMEAAEGVYVRYQAEELYAILCLESRRCQTAVMGENLGTVPAYVSAAMSRHGVQKMYVGQHEGGPARRHPLRLVPRDAVASLNTHDMAPFAAFLSGADLEDMQRLGLFGAAEVRQGKSRRRAIQHALAEFFHTKRFLARKSAETGELFKAFLEWLAASPARLVLVNLEDLWLETLPQNVPGTSDERPNWRRKARYALEEFSRRRAVVEMLQRLSELRRLPPGRS